MFEKMKIAKTRATQGFAGGGQPLESKKAFTLAETLITLTILGVIAAITVPMLINKQMEAANRTKLKKAMAAYEKALNQMIVDNDIKGSVKAWADTVANCGLTNPYFKFINGGNCRFQTADKVWWDITDIEHPTISLKEPLTDAMVEGVSSNSDDYKDDKTLFSMTGEITNGVVRINDQADTGLTDDAKANLDKIYAFINNSNNDDDSNNNLYANGCDPKDNTEEWSDTPMGLEASIKDCHGNSVIGYYDCSGQDLKNCNGFGVTVFDENDNNIASGSDCSNPYDISSCNYCTGGNDNCNSFGFTDCWAMYCCKSGFHWYDQEYVCVQNN